MRILVDIKEIVFAILAIILLGSCKENADILTFEGNDSYIYFSMPETSTAANIMEKYVDSISFSFVFEEGDARKQKELRLPMQVSGLAKEQDRLFKVEIDKEKTTIDLSQIELGEGLIKKGNVTGYLPITIKNHDALYDNKYALHLKLVPNENFKLGHSYNTSMKLEISDNLSKPDWWGKWQNKLGPFYQEVFREWIKIYHLGADPSPEFYNPQLTPGPYYYWDNMPPYNDQRDFPVVYMFLNKLKQYFDDNIVFPKNDPTQQRILLP